MQCRGGASVQVRHTPTDTHPVVSKDDGHSPPSVRIIPTSKVRDTVLLAEANTLKELKFFWPTPLSVASPHPSDARLQDAVHSPLSVHTTPASQSRPAEVEQKTAWLNSLSLAIHCRNMMHLAHHHHTATSLSCLVFAMQNSN